MYRIKIEEIDTRGLVDGVADRIENSDVNNFIGFYKEDNTRFAKVETISGELLHIFPERLSFK